MKELSIGEKAKRYDEAIEVARKIKNGEPINVPDGIPIPVAIFPELKESEDEKIIKSLIGHLKECRNNTRSEVMIGEYAKWIDWLEKKGEQKPVISDDALREGIAHFGITQYQIDNWLKKYVDVEKQSEQKSGDKVEPKFKIGNWVIDKQGIVHQIANVVENVTNHTYGYDIVGGGYFNDDNEGVRLWNISDAKDGDILVTKNKNIFIFKSISGYTIYDYCGLYFEKFEKSSGAVNGSLTVQLPIDYVPATKEQRDILFTKMKEAGYEWDAKNKQLKKIEQEKSIEFKRGYKKGTEDVIKWFRFQKIEEC